MISLSTIWPNLFLNEVYYESVMLSGEEPRGDGGVNIMMAVAIKQLHQQIQELKEEVKSLKEKSRERNKRSSYE